MTHIMTARIREIIFGSLNMDWHGLFVNIDQTKRGVFY
jgi:hypothetical protein